MYKRSLFFLVLSVTSVAQATWLQVEGQLGIDKFLNTRSMQRDGSVVRVEEMMNYRVPTRWVSVDIASIRWVNEYHCNSKQMRILSYSAHAEPLGSGDVLFSSLKPVPWAPIPDGSLASGVWLKVCATDRM